MQPHTSPTGFVRVRGAREHNLKNVNVDIPRHQLVVFTGISGSGKSSLAFGTLYAEAQRRYLESVAPYSRRLFHQLGVPQFDEIDGMPPAVALQQQRGLPTTRSSVGSVTTLSNLLRMLYSRAGDYPRNQPPLEAEAFSANTPTGACKSCHGLGRVYDATESSMVPDERLTIRERANCCLAPSLARTEFARHRHDARLRHRRSLARASQKGSQLVALYGRTADGAGLCRLYRTGSSPSDQAKEEPSYQGTFTSARRYVLQTFATTESAAMKKRVARYLVSSECPICHGKRLQPAALAVKFAGLDIADLSQLPLKRLAQLLKPYCDGTVPGWRKFAAEHPEKAVVVERINRDLEARLAVMLDLGLGYLSLDRSTPTLSPGELQRLRLATQVRSNLFGVVYVLDEPSAGLHPADTEALLTALDGLKAAGNSLFVVEHDLDVIRRADWVVDVGPDAGEHGGRILYNGPLAGLETVKESHTARYLFGHSRITPRPIRTAQGHLRLEGVHHNNVHDLGRRHSAWRADVRYGNLRVR